MDIVFPEDPYETPAPEPAPALSREELRKRLIARVRASSHSRRKDIPAPDTTPAQLKDILNLLKDPKNISKKHLKVAREIITRLGSSIADSLKGGPPPPPLSVPTPAP